MASKKQRLISVYAFPTGSKPIVRVECLETSIGAERLFKICCDTIGLHEKSRPFFALFRGLTQLVKKYSPSERIQVPVKTHPISIQKWSFDLSMESRMIRTDPVALKLLTLQYKNDLEMGRKHPTKEQLRELKDVLDVNFMCYKQYVHLARCIHDYTWTLLQNVEVVNKVKLVSNILQKGSKVDLACTPKKMIIIGQQFDLAIPWRKIRRFAEINESNTITFEVLMDSKKFTWVEFRSVQGTYLLQLVGEYIEIMNRLMKPPVFKQPRFVTEAEEISNEGGEETKARMITFALIKKELFGWKKKTDAENEKTYYEDFDAIDGGSSSGEDLTSSESEDSEEEDVESRPMSQASVRGSLGSRISAIKYLDENINSNDMQPGPSGLRRNTSYSSVRGHDTSSRSSVRATGEERQINSFSLLDF